MHIPDEYVQFQREFFGCLEISDRAMTQSKHGDALVILYENQTLREYNL